MRTITGACTALALSATVVNAQTPSDRAWTVLQNGLTSGEHETRVRAVEGLGLIVKNDRARQLAEAALKDGATDVRAAAATALGQIAIKSSVPRLIEAVHDAETEVVFSAASALLALGDPAAYQVYFAVLTGERKSGGKLLESQLDMLKDPDALARIGFETGIGFIPFGGLGYKAVKAFRQDTVSSVRAAAAQKIATDPDPASGKALAAAAGDEKWLVRASAASAIARRGDPALAAALVPRLDDEVEAVRFTAAAAIIRLAAPKGR
jgi:HEAT repeat protein